MDHSRIRFHFSDVGALSSIFGCPKSDYLQIHRRTLSQESWQIWALEKVPRDDPRFAQPEKQIPCSGEIIVDVCCFLFFCLSVGTRKRVDRLDSNFHVKVGRVGYEAAYLNSIFFCNSPSQLLLAFFFLRSSKQKRRDADYDLQLTTRFVISRFSPALVQIAQSSFFVGLSS
uniref:Uncharacterized protein n=1 Tax=Steinernema glaseri TaxID=37863 RepID=A0A1I7ZS56_9BILA